MSSSVYRSSSSWCAASGSRTVDRHAGHRGERRGSRRTHRAATRRSRRCARARRSPAVRRRRDRRPRPASRPAAQRRKQEALLQRRPRSVMRVAQAGQVAGRRVARAARARAVEYARPASGSPVRTSIGTRGVRLRATASMRWCRKCERSTICCAGQRGLMRRRRLASPARCRCRVDRGGRRPSESGPGPLGRPWPCCRGS